MKEGGRWKGKLKGKDRKKRVNMSRKKPDNSEGSAKSEVK